MASVDQSSGVDDETVLIQKAQADPAAFDAIYRLYLKRVYRYVRSHIGQDDAAADITQQVFLQALQALPDYAHSGTFGAWLFRIARHAVIDQRRRGHPLLSWDLLPEAAHPLDELSPETAALHHEAAEEIHQLLGHLDADKRELIALRFAAQLSIAEIAAIVGKKPEAVKKQISRILHALKEQYHDA